MDRIPSLLATGGSSLFPGCLDRAISTSPAPAAAQGFSRLKAESDSPSAPESKGSLGGPPGSGPSSRLPSNSVTPPISSLGSLSPTTSGLGFLGTKSPGRAAIGPDLRVRPLPAVGLRSRRPGPWSSYCCFRHHPRPTEMLEASPLLLHGAMHVPDSPRPPSPASQLPSASIFSKPDSASASIPTALASDCSLSASYGLHLRSRPLPAPLGLGPSSCMEPCMFPTPLGLRLQQARFRLGLGPNRVGLGLHPLGSRTASVSAPDCCQLPSTSVRPPAWSHARPRLPSASVSSKPAPLSLGSSSCMEPCTSPTPLGLRLQQARLRLGLGPNPVSLGLIPLDLVRPPSPVLDRCPTPPRPRTASVSSKARLRLGLGPNPIGLGSDCCPLGLAS